MKTQVIRSEKLAALYSINPKVNSLVRTLVALNGYDNLTKHAFFFFMSPDGADFTSDEIYETYQAIKFAEVCSE